MQLLAETLAGVLLIALAGAIVFVVLTLLPEPWAIGTGLAILLFLILQLTTHPRLYTKHKAGE